MNTLTLRTLGKHRASAARALYLTLSLVGWSAPNYAATTSSAFKVSVALAAPTAESGAGLCRSSTGTGAFGATVTVVCATGHVTGIEAIGRGKPWLPVHGGAYRYLTRVSHEDLSATIDAYAGAGTSTAFRIVNLAGREYVEMTVGW